MNDVVVQKRSGAVRGSSKHSLRLILIFCGIVFCMILGVLTYRFVRIVQESQFDGSHVFNVVISENNQNQKKTNVFIVSFSPPSQRISVLTISTNVSVKNIGQLIEVPIDAYVLVPKEFMDTSLTTMYRNILLGYVKVHTTLTPIDIARLWWYAQITKPEHLIQKSLTTSKDKEQENLLQQDKLITSLFQDQMIASENLSIQIVNGTGIAGFGSRLARLVSNTGGSVVAVTNASSVVEHSQIRYNTQKSYSVKRFARALEFPVIDEKTSKEVKSDVVIADIIIIAGKDAAYTKVF